MAHLARERGNLSRLELAGPGLISDAETCHGGSVAVREAAQEARMAMVRSG